MTNKTSDEKANIDQCIRKLNTIHKQRLGAFGPPLGMILIILFAFALLPLFILAILQPLPKCAVTQLNLLYGIFIIFDALLEI